MKILFIQKNLFPYFGVMSICGYLKQNGHSCFVMVDSQVKEKDFNARISEIRPDIIGFSVMSTEHSWLAGKVKSLKEKFPSIPVIVGGVHAVIYPEAVASIPGVDYVCYGEGELTLKQIFAHMHSKGPIEEVGGIFFKKDGNVHQTELNNLIAIDTFGEDRSAYYSEYRTLKDTPMKNFSSSRGCPFKCSFCANASLQRRYEGRGPYIRRKTVSSFIDELEGVKNNYGMKSIYIADDLFVFDKKWLREFSGLYKKKIDVPFLCTCRADMLDEETVRLLADAGCHTVSFGVESGNENIRTLILKKHISDKQFLVCAGLLKDAGIRLQTSNMFCLPEETVDDAIKTIDLNIKMKTSFTMASIFLPLPKTELADFCIKKGILKQGYSFEDMPNSFITHSVLRLENKDTIERLQKVAALIIQYPRLRNILIMAAKHIRLYYFHFMLYLVGTVLRFRSERKLTLPEAMGYLWLYRKNV